jgi:hypothetical protein
MPDTIVVFNDPLRHGASAETSELAESALARRGCKRIVEQEQPEINLCLPNAPKLFPTDLIN